MGWSREGTWGTIGVNNTSLVWSCAPGVNNTSLVWSCASVHSYWVNYAVQGINLDQLFRLFCGPIVSGAQLSSHFQKVSLQNLLTGNKRYNDVQLSFENTFYFVTTVTATASVATVTVPTATCELWLRVGELHYWKTQGTGSNLSTLYTTTLYGE